MSRLPAAYVECRAGRACAFVKSELSSWLSGLLARNGSLYAWAASLAEPTTLEGRGPVYVVDAASAARAPGERWAVRRYRRGGWATPLGERYARVGLPRPLRELAASDEARARGVRTPRVVAGAAYRHGAFYRADIVTELVPGGRTLADALLRRDGPLEAGLHAAGSLIRSLEQAGVVHADASAGNVLLAGSPGEVNAHALDLDRARILPAGAADGRMRARLERSLRKVGRRTTRPLTDPEWRALRTGFESAP